MDEKEILKRAKKLAKLSEKIIKNLGEDEDEVLMNAMGLIKNLSQNSLLQALKICQEREDKNAKTR